MVDIIVDGKKLKAKQGSSVIQDCEQAGVEVPRFCYHDKMKVAGNCRMCLVDLEGAPKPIAASQKGGGGSVGPESDSESSTSSSDSSSSDSSSSEGSGAKAKAPAEDWLSRVGDWRAMSSKEQASSLAPPLPSGAEGSAHATNKTGVAP